MFYHSELIVFVIGITIGFILTWILFRQKIKSEYDRGVASDSGEMAVALERIVSLRGANEELKAIIGTKDEKLSELEHSISKKNIDLAEMRVKFDEDYKHMEEKIGFLNEARNQMKEEFQNLANQILEDKGSKIAIQNKENIENILTPLRDQLKDFRIKVEEVYVQESEGRAALKNEITHLKDLSIQVSQDANNLAEALKGDNKAQGTWGEIVLERVLELSGLEKGREYETQFHTLDIDGNRLIPDAVVHLPQQRDVIIDSKVSLIYYELYCSAGSDEERTESIKNHIQAIRRHIQNLSGKQYDQLPEIKSLDYVIMFIPIEAAFIAAVKNDSNLYTEAFNKNIILVCPSTLLVTLKVIGYSWKIQDQTNNAQTIARKAADLYDKFCAFLTTMQDVGESIKKAGEKYNTAMKTLSSGKGNLIKRAEEFKALGVNAKKDIPTKLLESSDKSEDLETSVA